MGCPRGAQTLRPDGCHSVRAARGIRAAARVQGARPAHLHHAASGLPTRQLGKHDKKHDDRTSSYHVTSKFCGQYGFAPQFVVGDVLTDLQVRQAAAQCARGPHRLAADADQRPRQGAGTRHGDQRRRRHHQLGHPRRRPHLHRRDSLQPCGAERPLPRGHRSDQRIQPSTPSRGADPQPTNHHVREDRRSRPGTARCRMPLPYHGGHGRVHGRSRILDTRRRVHPGARKAPRPWPPSPRVPISGLPDGPACDSPAAILQ